ncbi:methyl-accepting chemotaxis protein [Paenibacillus cellulosilyticus]|uniref:Methyl-accepting chemotaxis protein n=1 Tax=Paenibacillus cellulosilyticus TaxID=375489 RepID=A0A2V2YQ56_9BACL|nr:methyl-accepting chemotaxis protein [Paenibacillus cellulosilyticus]PWV98672.1 methyl-accepting chemotaxis protein [Paenibacillus cellulosilyticus]QKS43822.1 HAMP domain-containing protein [Paenibacillus cellulosilyticus]
MFLFRSRLVMKLSVTIVAILIVLSSFFIYIEVQSTRYASEEAIGSFSIHTAEAYAGQFDVKSYDAFLKDQQESELYWTIREQMNEYRERIGAMYVYTVQIDDKKQPILLIDGQPKDSDSASPIGEVTDMPTDAIEAVLQGQTAKSGIIKNPEYGDYISSYAPLHDADGTVIGVLGIDTDISVSSTIYHKVVKDSMPQLILVGVLTLLAAVVIAVLMARALRPLAVVVNSAEALARGDLAEAKAQLESKQVRSKDEIGNAYAAMNQMVERLGVTLGDVVRDVKVTTQQLVTSTTDFRSEADQMVALNEELEQSMVQLADGARHQRVGAEDSAKAMEEITLAIGRVSEASTSVSVASGEAIETAEQGRQSIQWLREQVATIADVAQQTTKSVELLNTHMEEIAPVLQSISSIADQTKLLALNASIEAARAGEHGAGFAIVAGEVRKLAEASTVSAMHITSLLQQIGQESANIGARMLASGEEMTRGTTLSGEVELLFNQTVERFIHVNGQIQEISASAEEVLAGSEEVAASVEQIAQISNTAADNTAAIQRMSARQLAAAKRIADTTEQLQQNSDGLEAAVEKFRL